MKNLVICSVVTERVLEEYLLMRLSFSLHHREKPRWHVRCDGASTKRLQRELPDTTTKLFTEVAPTFRSQWSPEFRGIVEQKMIAIGDAWTKLGAEAVLFLDADIVFTSTLLPILEEMDAQLVLTPHYWPIGSECEANRYGFYNTGFVLTRNPSFWQWWLKIFRRHPESFSDQWCLNLLPEGTNPSHAPPEWNVGYWRRSDPWDLPEIPVEMKFFHAHLFAEPNAENSYTCGEKDFVLQLLEYLRRRGRSSDRRLLKYILARTPNGYYRHILNGDIEVVTQCDTSRAGRAVLLAQSVPKQIRVICAVNGSKVDFWRAAKAKRIPCNLTVLESPEKSPHPTNYLRNRAFEASTARWLCFIDIDFVFQRGFWYLLFLKYERELRSGCCVCPVPLWSAQGAFFTGKKDSWQDCELREYHHPPRGWDTAGKAELFKFHERWLPVDEIGPSFMGKDITAIVNSQRHSMHPAEPWGVLDRQRFVWADEDFCGRTFDKQQFISALVDRGIRFHFAPDLFIFHNHHPSTNSPEYRSEQGLSVTLWIKRYAGKPPRFLHFSRALTSDLIVSWSLLHALDAAYGPENLFLYVPAESRAPIEHKTRERGMTVVEACFAKTRYIYVEAAFDESFLGYGYRIFTVVEDPVDYWVRRAIVGSGQFSARDGVARRVKHLLDTGAIRDGHLVRHIAGAQGGILRAVHNLQHLSFVLDASDPPSAQRILSNVSSQRLRISVPPAYSRGEIDPELRDMISGLVPDDLKLYEHIISCPTFGFGYAQRRKLDRANLEVSENESRFGCQTNVPGTSRPLR